MAESGFEELGQPRPTGKWVRVLSALAVLAAVTVGAIRVADSPPPHLPVAAPPMDHAAPRVDHVAPPLPMRVPMPAVETPSVDRRGHTRFVPYHPPRPCPRATDGQNACSTYPTVARSFLSAVLREYPQLEVEAAITQMLRATGPDVRAGLWSVEFAGVFRQLRLRIAIDRAEPPDEASVITTNGATTAGGEFVFYRYIVGRYVVQADLRGRHVGEVDAFELARLARDRRLLRPPTATMTG